MGSNPALCVTALRHVTIASYSRRAPPTTTDLANRWLTLPRHQAQRTQWTLRTRCPIHTSAPLARSLGSPCPNPQGSSRDGPGQWLQWQVELAAKYAELLMGGSRHKGAALRPRQPPPAPLSAVRGPRTAHIVHHQAVRPGPDSLDARSTSLSCRASRATEGLCRSGRRAPLPRIGLREIPRSPPVSIG